MSISFIYYTITMPPLNWPSPFQHASLTYGTLVQDVSSYDAPISQSSFSWWTHGIDTYSFDDTTLSAQCGRHSTFEEQRIWCIEKARRHGIESAFVSSYSMR
ncbi:predicted protein [Lichtheimia corymbifera JMRC:FSU:9682]|uniref:Uncharacterized protein n=1 Tax=Lichtheimia corymbifera JMRC:FSU:9682 TaxID=1263082 RepID=A0A068SGE9_9FUNG|nr:predicted protein [Lichtheimia corymbifera JMRC:FSU:9682]